MLTATSVLVYDGVFYFRCLLSIVVVVLDVGMFPKHGGVRTYVEIRGCSAGFLGNMAYTYC